jgi:hypothetical protein
MKPININIQGGLEGYYQLTVRDVATGKITKQTKPFKNLITNVGLDYFFLGFSGPFSFLYVLPTAYVGTGNTTPTTADTQLTTYLAQTNGGGSSPMSAWVYVAAAGGVPPYWTSTGSWTFAAGTATGTLSEVGIGGDVTGAPYYYLQSHALIVDGSGVPTTITVLSTEQLTLTYTLNLYWNTTTQTGSINISGVSYALSWLPTNISSPAGSPTRNFQNNIAGLVGYNGTLGTALTLPSGTHGSATGISVTSYTTGSYFQQVTYTCDVSHLNFTGGINILVVQSWFHYFQMEFVPNIPKDNTYTFTFVCNFSLSRYP